MNVKSKCLKIRNLPSDGEYLGHINSKPYAFIIIGILIGAALLATSFYLVGIVLCLVFLYCLVFVKNIKLVEFYKDYVVFFLNNGNDECFLIFWQDVASWEMESHVNDLDILHIHLKNGKDVSLKCLSRKKIETYFRTYVTSVDEKTDKQHA